MGGLVTAGRGRRGLGAAAMLEGTVRQGTKETLAAAAG